MFAKSTLCNVWGLEMGFRLYLQSTKSLLEWLKVNRESLWENILQVYIFLHKNSCVEHVMVFTRILTMRWYQICYTAFLKFPT